MRHKLIPLALGLGVSLGTKVSLAADITEPQQSYTTATDAETAQNRNAGQPTDPAYTALLSQARLWQARARDDLALAALNRLFSIAPDQPDGLGQLGLMQLRTNQRTEAEQTLEILRRVQPGHPDIARMETLIRLEGVDKGKLQHARVLAKEDKSKEALAILTQLYPHGPPTGDLAVEYYSLFPYNEKGWKEALAGLQRVVADHPDNLRYRLLLAEHITIRKPGDPSALNTIIGLTSHPLHGRSARSIWRRAMLRLEPHASSVQLIEQYLGGEKIEDSAVNEHLAKIRSELGKQAHAKEEEQRQAMLRAEAEQQARLRAEAEQQAAAQAMAEKQAVLQLSAKEAPGDAAQVSAEGEHGSASETRSATVAGTAVQPESRSAEVQQAASVANKDQQAARRQEEEQKQAAMRAEEERLASLRLEEAQQRQLMADPYYQARNDGLAFLEQERQSDAESRLLYALKGRPDDPEVLGGLGRLRMQQGRHAEAGAYFQQARKHDTDRGRWAGLIRTARFWALMREASDAANSNDHARAESILLEARTLNRREPVLLVALGRVYRAQGRHGESEAQFREALRHEPDNANAIRELAMLYLHSDREQDVDALLASTGRDLRKSIEPDLNRERASTLKEKAEALIAAGDTGQAMGMLERGAAYDPSNPWLRYGLAKLYAAQGNAEKGHELFRVLVDHHARNPDVHYAYALYLQNQDQPIAALSSLEQVPAAERTASMTSMQRTLWVNVTARHATALAKHGQADAARAVLAEAEQAVGADPELGLDLADAWLQIPDASKAHAMLSALTTATPPSTDWALRHARLLGAAGGDDMVPMLIDRLSAVELSDEQAAAAIDLAIDGAIRRADAFQKDQRPADAVRELSSLRQTHPKNERLLKAEIGYQRAAGMTERAEAGYRELLSLRPGNRDAAVGLIAVLSEQRKRTEARRMIDEQLRLAEPMTVDQMADLAGSLIALDDFDTARALNAAALAQKPDEARVLEQASQIARRDGRIDEAIDFQRRSLASRMMQGDSAAQHAVSTLRQMAAEDRLALPQPRTAPRPAQRDKGVEIIQGYHRMQDRTGQPLALQPLLWETLMVPRSDYHDDAAAMPVAADQFSGDDRYAAHYAETTAPGRKPVLLPELQDMQSPASRFDSAVDLAQATPAGSTSSMPQQNAADDNRSTLPLEIIPPQVPTMDQGVDSSYIYRRLADMLDEKTTWGSGAVDIRTRSGSEGRSEFFAAELPLEWKRQRTRQGRWTYRADLVSVRAGDLDLSQAGNVFGSTLLCQPVCNAGIFSQSERGVALNAAFERNNTRYDIGTTPLGFPLQTVTGGILHTGRVGAFGYSLDVSRRPVASSLLAYAGTRDPRTGRLWGGVRATGARLGFSLDQGGTFGGWSSIGLHRLDGENVQTNRRMQLMAGGTYRHINESNRLLQFGLTLMHWRMSENAGEYTFGHGGYFSPGRFSSVSVPVTYARRHARFSYAVRGSISRTRTRTDAAAYFPTDRAYQTEAERIAALTGVTPFYGRDTGGGFGRSFSFSWEYQADLRLFVGGRLELDRSRDYAPNRYAVYLRYAFDNPSAQPVSFMPEPVLPISQF